MTPDIFFRELKQAAARVNLTDPYRLAMMLAMAEKESFVDDHRVSILAAKYKNPFGIKYQMPDDIDKYVPVTLPANEFESEPQTYRAYDSYEHAISNWVWHIDHSTIYQTPKKRGHQAWLQEIAERWCPVDPHYVHDVVDIYRRWVQELT